ncbi:MAG: hypothetical protein ACXVRK_10925 [Gaiellaceae bacterium]
MRFLLRLPGRRLALVAMAIFVVAGGIAYASIPDAGTGTYHACMMKNTGAIRIIDPATQQCRSPETEITFNQTGPKGDQGIQGVQGQQGPPGADGSNGANGVSPTVTQLAAGDPNCPAGGAAITDAAGSTAYVCSGQNGHDGQNGADGQPFSGTFSSPNGLYSIGVTDTGVTLTGAGSSINISGTGVRVDTHGTSSVVVMSSNDLTLRSGNTATVQGDTALTLKGGGQVTVQSSGGATVQSGGVLALTGGLVNINGSSCLPAARATDHVSVTPVGDGIPVLGTIVAGSSTVCIG